jgi:hypothetical protein
LKKYNKLIRLQLPLSCCERLSIFKIITCECEGLMCDFVYACEPVWSKPYPGKIGLKAQPIQEARFCSPGSTLVTFSRGHGLVGFNMV